MEDLKHSETWRVFRIQSELVEGFETLNDIGHAVAIFGSSRMLPGSYYYEQAVELGKTLSNAGLPLSPAAVLESWRVSIKERNRGKANQSA